MNIYKLMYSCVCFCARKVWLDLFADELVALVETLGVETAMKPATLGLTLLAIGNSVGDLVADTAFARAGNPQMGFSSCFGSLMFNDIVGNRHARTYTHIYIYI